MTTTELTRAMSVAAEVQNRVDHKEAKLADALNDVARDEPRYVLDEVVRLFVLDIADTFDMTPLPEDYELGAAYAELPATRDLSSCFAILAETPNASKVVLDWTYQLLAIEVGIDTLDDALAVAVVLFYG